MTGTKWQRSEQWVGTEVEDSFVMVNIESGKYVSLNPTAAAIWRALEHPHDQDELCRILTAEFDIGPDECHRSVSQALARMRDLDLATPA